MKVWRGRHLATYGRRLALAVMGLLFLQLAGTLPVQAWKPYTHNYIGTSVWNEVTATGTVSVTVNGTKHTYPVDSRIVDALRSWPAFYNAGVVGPDGFPDITYGQAVIHPEHTGQWMRYLFQQAWAAQNDPQYSTDERGQILAFTYGYMIHAAGDMWAHTLINSFAGGVFPSVFKMFDDLVNKGDPTRLLIGLRHVIAEGYVGNATPGWDAAEGDDVPDPTKPCNPVNLDPPDAICNFTSTDPNVEKTREELSNVCNAAMTANPPMGTTCLVTGAFGQLVPDVSQNSTLGIPFDAPQHFLNNVLIDISAPTPLSGCWSGTPNADPNGDGIAREGCPGGVYKLSSDPAANPDKPAVDVERGPALDSFYDLKAQLQVKAAAEQDRVDNNCLVDVPTTDCHHDGSATITVSTVRGVGTFQIGRWVCTTACVGDPTISIPAALIRDYVNAWIDDIDAGLAHWTDFNLAIAKGLFDPQTRRDAENDACRTTGPQDIFNTLRVNCEKAVTLKDAVFFSVDNVYSTGEKSWINRYLIPMVGFPDFVGDLRSLGQAITDAIDDVFQFLGLFNPLSAILADLKEFVVSTIENYIEKAYGIDIPAFEEFFTHPTQWFCGNDGSGASLTIRGVTIKPSGLFSTSEHERMDGYMFGDAGQAHHSDKAGLPTECSPLNDGASGKFDTQMFAAFKDSVMMSKLLLLNGSQLNQALGDALVSGGVIKSASSVTTYASTANVMVDSMDGSGRASGTPPDLWLQLIDGDHAWRKDGLPRFCDEPVGTNTCQGLPSDITGDTPAPTVRHPNADDTSMEGGNGSFPIWSSCLLRPAFRGVFTDWENDVPDATGTPVHRNFPDLGDAVGPDASVTSAAGSALAVAGTQFTGPTGTKYIAGDNVFTVSASDSVFTNGALGIEYRTYPDGTTPAPFPPANAPGLPNGTTFSIGAGPGDGVWVVDTQGRNPCNNFLTAAVATSRFFLDTTPPVITINQPAATTYNHSQLLTLDYSVSDGNGSGVKSFSPTLDGAATLAGHGLQSGQAINLLTELSLGTHTFRVDAVDNLNNADSGQVTFTIIVTAASIEDDVKQFFAAGKIKNAGEESSLLAKLMAAAAKRAAGDCSSAASIYQAFITELQAQSGKGVDPAAASIMIADANYLIQNCP